MEIITLNGRTPKDLGRKNGLTILTDPGLSTTIFQSIIEEHHHLIDAVVFSEGVVFHWGSDPH